ncbi:MAG: hypothetical protein J6T10_25105 [Methanobrevibacter sp.]|nr:hypothetical protein [Methanobrevibacter sp.]
MIAEFVDGWYRYKDELEDYFRNTPQKEYSKYSDIVKLLFEKVINQEDDYGFDTENFLVIDDGHYQGTQIFIFHKNVCQPNIEDYVYTDTYYGSCSYCDTLQRIHNYEDGYPNEEQINSYMQLALNLLQKCKYFEEEESD